MSRRCFVEALWQTSQTFRRTIGCRRYFGTTWCQAEQQSSRVPERTRKLPDNRENFRLRRWQRYLLVGTIAGYIMVQGYKYYEQRQSRQGFIKFVLVKKEPVSSTAAIFELEPQDHSTDFDAYKEAWRKGVWNVHLKQPQIQIVRAYTPLPPTKADLKASQPRLRFLIRRDPYGEVSNYIHNLPIGADFELRGPNMEYYLTPDIRQVLFFAGGTGIAPALQIAHTMFESEENDAIVKQRKLHILWANRRREDCLGGQSDAPIDSAPAKSFWTGFVTPQKPKEESKMNTERGVIVRELEELKQKFPGQVTIDYFVNEEETWIDEDEVFKALSRFDDKDFSTGHSTQQEQRQILISGPSGFITYLAGPKEWKNGREEQGGVGKIIAHAISRNPHSVKVWKI